MERREREAILRQGVTRPETSRERRDREALAEDLEGNPLTGAPLRQRIRNFRPDADAQIAALGGPLAWMRRLRAIELAIEEHLQRLGDAYELRESPQQWRALAESWNFAEVNDLIERHNRFYPAESRLPMNPRTGDFVRVNGKPYTRALLDAAWILTRFPADGQT